MSGRKEALLSFLTKLAALIQAINELSGRAGVIVLGIALTLAFILCYYVSGLHGVLLGLCFSNHQYDDGENSQENQENEPKEGDQTDDDGDNSQETPKNEPWEGDNEELVLCCEKFAASATSEGDAKERFFYGTLCDLSEENVPNGEQNQAGEEAEAAQKEKRWERLKLLVRNITLEVRKAGDPVSAKVWTLLYEYVLWKYKRWEEEKKKEKGEAPAVDREKEKDEFSGFLLQYLKDSVASRVNNVDTSAVARNWILGNIRSHRLELMDPKMKLMLLLQQKQNKLTLMKLRLTWNNSKLLMKLI